ncbi:MAG: nucleotidyltransferase family protein [bacterium]|nr:nucleotidyltransferase family protein [bacterium]
MVDAVVLAGRANTGKLAGVSTAANEALIPIAGKPMLHYVLEALDQAAGVGRVAVVGPRALLAPGSGSFGAKVVFVEPAGDVIANLLAGVDALDPDGMVLAVTSDIPLLRARVVDGFLAECAARPADLHYPFVTRELAEARFPGMRRTYACLRDGMVTGGNLVLFDPAVLRARAGEARAFYAARKNPLRLAGLLGPTFIIQLVLRRLSVAGLEATACRLFGLRAVHAVRTAFPEIVVDVDKPDDYSLVGGFLGEREGCPAGASDER